MSEPITLREIAEAADRLDEHAHAAGAKIKKPRAERCISLGTLDRAISEEVAELCATTALSPKKVEVMVCTAATVAARAAAKAELATLRRLNGQKAAKQ